MTKALIIGGGIGGLTAAVALRQRGLDVEIYEAAPELRPVGKGIWVPTNAMQVLASLGLDEPVRRAGWELERIQLRDFADGLLQDYDLGPVRKEFGHTTVSIHRAALVETFAAALPAGSLRLGRRCTAILPDDGGVTVRFADGDEARGDVLIGADGVHSVVREAIFPGVPLRYSGVTCYRGVAEIAHAGRHRADMLGSLGRRAARRFFRDWAAQPVLVRADHGARRQPRAAAAGFRVAGGGIRGVPAAGARDISQHALGRRHPHRPVRLRADPKLAFGPRRSTGRCGPRHDAEPRPGRRPGDRGRLRPRRATGAGQHAGSRVRGV